MCWERREGRKRVGGVKRIAPTYIRVAEELMDDPGVVQEATQAHQHRPVWAAGAAGVVQFSAVFVWCSAVQPHSLCKSRQSFPELYGFSGH